MRPPPYVWHFADGTTRITHTSMLLNERAGRVITAVSRGDRRMELGKPIVTNGGDVYLKDETIDRLRGVTKETLELPQIFSDAEVREAIELRRAA